MNTNHGPSSPGQGRARGARGYLLIEALIGGAIIAVAISALLGQLADARRQTILAEREIEAQQLVTQKFEQLRAAGYTGLPTAAVTETVALGASYRRFTSVSAAATDTMNGINMTYRDATITICAPVQVCTSATVTTGTTVRLQQRFRLYQAVN